MPWIFKGRKHPKLRYVLGTYYTLHTIASAFFVTMFIVKIFLTPFNFKCQPVKENSINQDLVSEILGLYKLSHVGNFLLFFLKIVSRIYSCLHVV